MRTIPFAALALLPCLAAVEPVATPDVEALVASAKAAADDGNETAAMAALDRALEARPRDAALWALKGDLALQLHNPTLARTAYREADRLDPQERELDKLGELPVSGQHWRLEAGGQRDSYTDLGGLGSQLHVGVTYRQAEVGAHRGWYVGASAARIDRFDEVNGQGQVEGGVRLLPRLALRGSAAVAPGATTIARWQVAAGADVTLHREATLLLDVRHADARDPDHQELTFAPGLRLGSDQRPLQLVARLLQVSDHRSAGGTTHGVAWQAGAVLHPARFRGWQLDATYTQGETAALPMPIAYSRTYAAGLEIPLDHTLALRLEGAYEVRDAAYDHATVGGVVLVRF